MKDKLQTEREPEQSHENLSRSSRQTHSPAAPGQTDAISSLHRSIGNARVARAVRALGIQGKLTVSSPGDRFEKEAEQVAHEVMTMTDSTIAQKSSPDAESISCSSIAQRIQSLLYANKSPQPDCMTAAQQHQESEVGSDLESQISAQRSGGSAMDNSERGFFESRFGADFGNVKLHTDSQAATAARDLNARAFTVGNDIFFGAGEHQPGSHAGRSLMAHELTHVVQQTPAASRQMLNKAAAALPKKTVTVNVTYLHGGSTDIATHLTKANSVYTPASVDIKKGTEKTFTEAESKAIIGNDLILDEFNDPKNPTAEEQALFKENRAADTITMYYVKGMSAGHVGEAFNPTSGQPVGFVYASTNSRTWPHELGHIMLDEGGHPADNDNFMAQTSTATGVEKMTDAQVTKIRGSKYAK